jgi:hypothetical protein
MSATDLRPLSYSADVRMQLSVNGHTFQIGQLGPDFVILRDAADHPATDAEITLWIDGREDRWRVYLPAGIHVGTPVTPIAATCDGSTVR